MILQSGVLMLLSRLPWQASFLVIPGCLDVLVSWLPIAFMNVRRISARPSYILNGQGRLEIIATHVG
jgi:hypothetical protein